MAKALPLETRVRDRGFFPSVKDEEGLVALLATTDDDLAKDVERALVRLGPGLSASLRTRFATAVAPARARLLKVVARLGGGDEVVTFLLDALEDKDPKARRSAASALGRLPREGAQDARIEGALVAALDRETSAPHRRTLVEALGKIGGAVALEAIRRVEESEGESELARIKSRAVLMAERSQAREVPSSIHGEGSLAKPTTVLFTCRRGLEELMVDELGESFGARVTGPGRAEGTLKGALAEVFRSRTLLDVSFKLPHETRAKNETLVEPVVRALTGDRALAIFRAFTRGRIRFRLAFQGGGHRRSVVWSAAARVASMCPELTNDPTKAPWEAVVRERGDRVDVELRPKGLVDPRFRHRVADVPAASHPTLAAALVHVAGLRADDVVWDPFVGSGLELVERALAGPYARLVGSDIDPKALEMAFANLDAARVKAKLVEADARTFAPEGVTLILTNPPMGRRVVHHADLGALLDAFVDHAARVLVPGGRFVWLSPSGVRTAKRARAAGLECVAEIRVDMGGFDGVLQRFEKPAASSRRR